MNVPVIRMLTDGLKSLSYGINVKLAGLSLDISDAVPPTIATITNEVDSIYVTLQQVPSDVALPAVFVSQDSEYNITADDMNNYREAELPLLIRYVCKEVNTSQAFTDTYYTLQAVMHCLSSFVLNENAGDRVRNNVQIIDVVTLAQTKAFEKVDDAWVTGGLRVTFKVRDILNS